MKMNDIRDIHIKIREKYSPEVLSPEILYDIIHILFEYENVEEKIHEDKPEALPS